MLAAIAAPRGAAAARRGVLILLLSAAALLGAGCSLRQLAFDTVGDALAGSRSVYEAEADVMLIGDALPFSVKLLDSLVAESPRHRGLLLAASRACLLYARGYVDLANATHVRAHRLALRSFDYAMRALETGYPDLRAGLARDPAHAVQKVADPNDVESLHAAMAALGVAIGHARRDAVMLARLPEVDALLGRSLALDEAWNTGALHEFAVVWYGARPGAFDRAAVDRHYARALALSRGTRAALFVAYAEGVSVRAQDRPAFDALLDRALAVDLEARPEERLQNAQAQIVVKLGTIAPDGSVWTDALTRIARDWREASGGKVELRIYAGGVLGGEDELVRKLQRRTIDAVTLSGSGLPALDRSFDCLNIPLLFDSNDELDYVRDRVAPGIERRLETKGFLVLNWAIAGWVHIFAKEAIRVPADLRRQRFWMTSGDPALEKVYKDFGLKVVPLPATEMLTSLQTGLIDATAAPPLFALLDRSFQVAGHMLDLNWGALNAATVVSAAAWERIPAELRPRLIDAARRQGVAMRDVGRKAGDDAIRECRSGD